jgi:acetyltransferase-like isoleucine patch superfamily enzyme
MSEKNYFAHESSYIDDSAEIGKGTKIWINVQIREHAHIGNDCTLGKDTYIDKYVSVGNRVKIQNGASMGHGATIEDDVFVGPYALITNDRFPRAFNKDWQITKTLIKKGASIGANATIVCGITIGEYAMVGAGSVVTKDVPPYTLVVGNPAKQIARVCKCGGRIVNNICSLCGKKDKAPRGKEC